MPDRIFFPTFSFLLFSFFLCTAFELSGQIFPEDVRLSGNRSQPFLPKDAMIQSAARIGDLTLVVWGSSRNVTDTSAANVLYRQMLRDTMRLGEPEPLTDDGFYPFDMVRVIALEDYFLVVWNDRQTGSGKTWSVTIDTSGAVGVPQLWEGTYVPTGSGVQTVRLQDRVLAVWNDTASESIVAQQTERNGMASEGPFRLAAGYATGVFPGIPAAGETLIDRGVLPPIVVAADGTIHDVEGKAAAKFSGVYSICSDGSVITLANGLIEEYGSVTDTMPLRTTPAPIPKRMGPWVTVKGSEYIAKDREGGVRVFFSAYMPSDITRCDGDYCPAILEGLFVVTERAPGLFGDPVQADEEIVFWKYYRNSIERIHSYSVDTTRRLCNDAYQQRKTILLQIAMYRPGQSPLIVDDTVHFAGFHGDTSAIWPANAPSIKQLQAERCLSCTQSTVSRLISSGGSRVALAFDSASLTLQAPLASLVASTSHYSPDILRAGNHFLVPALSFGFDSTALTYNWNGAENSVSPAVPSNRIPFFDRSDNARYARMTLHHTGGPPLLHIFQSQVFKGANGEEAFQSLYSLHMPTELGWKEIVRAAPVHPSRFYSVLSVARDPDDGMMLVAAGWLPNLNTGQPADSITVTAYSPDGNLLWQADSLKVASLGFHLVPLQGGRFAGIGFDKRIYQFDGDSLLESGLPLPLISSSYRTFYDESFLWAYESLNTISIERRNSRGELIKHRQVPVNSGSGDYHFCFNPSDSAVALLFTRRFTGTPQENGVWAIILDKELQVTDTLRRISVASGSVARPSGIFYNDTLYAVWEDSRNGNPEIYGNAVVPVTRAAPAGVGDEGMREEGIIASVCPDPAGTIIRINLRKEAGPDARAELWDMAGKRRYSTDIPAGTARFDLPCEALTEGLYILRVLQNNRQESEKILIVR